MRPPAEVRPAPARPPLLQDVARHLPPQPWRRR